MKKGVSSLIAWVLLIGFAVTLAVFVSRWSLQLSQKTTEGTTEMIEGDIQCSDVSLSGHCEGGQVIVKNSGTLTIKYILKSGEDNIKPIGEEDKGLRPNKQTTLSPGTYTPIIEVEGKKVYCPSKKQTFNC